MDATELLTRDHDVVRALFQQFKGGGGISGLVKRLTGNVSTRERRMGAEKVCRELEDAVEHHASDEEREMFPRVRDLMPEADRARLGRRLRTAKRLRRAVRKPRVTRKSVTGGRATKRKRAKQSR